MLALKLFLVPTFLLMLTLASQRFGPAVAGWLAGLPVIAGPVLFVLAIESGAGFAATAAASSTAAVLASVSFALTFSHACRRLGLTQGLTVALFVWFLVAFMLARWSPSPVAGFSIAVATVIVAPRLFPTIEPVAATWQISRVDLLLRMAAGAALTFAVTLGAQTLGPGWAGVLSVAPMLSLVLAVFSFRKAGAAFTITLLRAMAVGFYSFTAFCTTLAFALPHLSIAAAFGLAVLACAATQRATQLWLMRAKAQR